MSESKLWVTPDFGINDREPGTPMRVGYAIEIKHDPEDQPTITLYRRYDAKGASMMDQYPSRAAAEEAAEKDRGGSIVSTKWKESDVSWLQE